MVTEALAPVSTVVLAIAVPRSDYRAVARPTAESVAKGYIIELVAE